MKKQLSKKIVDKLNLLGYMIIFLIVGGVCYGGWQMKRSWNYSFSYEDMVQSTVCETVKPEYVLPGKCQ